MDETTSGRRWLQLAYRWLMPVALVASISVAAVTVIDARTSNGSRHDGSQVYSEGNEQSEDHECEGRKGHGRFAAGFSELAELVGTDTDGLKTALSEGKTLAEIAEENDVEAQTVIDALVAKANERIAAAVESGKLTVEEGEIKKSDAATKIEDLVNNGFDKENFRGWGKSRWRGHGQGLNGSVEHNW